MKRKIVVLFSLILIVCTIGACFTSCDIQTTPSPSLEEVVQKYSEKILEINDSELMNMNEITHISDFLCSSGILIVHHNYYTSISTSAKLQFPLSMTNDKDKNIIDLATIYYMYGNNDYGVFVVSGTENQSNNLDALIIEAIETVLYRQSLHPVVTVADNNTADSLGLVDVIVAVEPKGKLRASYEIFTILDYHDLDFYIIKANITGLPGCILSADNANYKKAFQIENLSTTISTPTTSTTIDAYGPHTTSIESSSYSVDIGISVDNEGSLAISGGWNYTREIINTGIESYCTEKKATWDVTLKKDTQKSSFTFEPTASFKCPYNKSSVEIYATSSCIFDSWYSLSETVTLERTIICTPSSLD